MKKVSWILQVQQFLLRIHKLGQGDFCSFDQKKVPFLSIYLLHNHKKKLNTRKTMLTSISSIAFVTYWTSTGLRNVWLLTLNTIFYLHNHTLKFNISITQSYFKVPKYVRLNSTYLFIMRIPNKREFQQIALNKYIRSWL